MRRTTMAGVMLLVAAAAWGCAGGGFAGASMRVAHEPGGAAPGGPLVIEVDACSADRFPGSFGRPWASDAGLITGPFNQPLAASPSPAESLVLSIDAALPPLGYSADFGTVVAGGSSRIPVPAGFDTTIHLEVPGFGSRAAIPLVELIIRPGDPVPQVSLRAHRIATEEEVVLGHTAARNTQTVLVAWPLPGPEGQFAVAMPAFPDRALDKCSLWQFRVRAPDLEEAEEIEAMAAKLRQEHSAVTAQSPWRAVIDRLKQPAANHRSALALAAMETGAEVTAEVAVLVHDKDISAICTAAAQSLDAAPPAVAQAGWLMDRAVLVTLARMQSKNALDRALGAMLTVRYGEVGRDVQTLAQLAEKSATRDAMEVRLVSEHLVLLDDSSPAVRVRAYEWLRARSKAPPGFDPLAPAKERREAVARHLEALTERNQ